MRSFTTNQLVQLPKLDAASAQALGAKLIAVAREETKKKKPPERVVESLDELAAALRGLNDAVAKRLPGTAAVDPAETKAADVALDACWSSLFDVLTGWAKLPGVAKAALAADARAQLYPESLKFTQLPYKLEWAESDTRLLFLAKSPKLEATLGGLGVAEMVEALRQAHAEYGRALGITSPAASDPATPTVREALDALAEALRDYVVQVAASVKKSDPKSQQLAETLLEPIASWETPGGKGGEVAAAAAIPSAEAGAVK